MRWVNNADFGFKNYDDGDGGGGGGGSVVLNRIAIIKIINIIWLSVRK